MEGMPDENVDHNAVYADERIHYRMAGWRLPLVEAATGASGYIGVSPGIEAGGASRAPDFQHGSVFHAIWRDGKECPCIGRFWQMR